MEAGGNMHDKSGWVKIPCEESDQIRNASYGVSSGLTDLDGVYGQAVVYTEWMDEMEGPLLRDYRWPHGDRPCEHWVPVPQPDVKDVKIQVTEAIQVYEYDDGIYSGGDELAKLFLNTDFDSPGQFTVTDVWDGRQG